MHTAIEISLNLSANVVAQIDAWILLWIFILSVAVAVDSRGEKYFWAFVGLLLILLRGIVLVKLPAAYGYDMISDLFDSSQIKWTFYIVAGTIITLNILDKYGVDYDSKSEGNPICSDCPVKQLVQQVGSEVGVPRGRLYRFYGRLHKLRPTG